MLRFDRGRREENFCFVERKILALYVVVGKLTCCIKVLAVRVSRDGMVANWVWSEWESGLGRDAGPIAEGALTTASADPGDTVGAGLVQVKVY